jgi:ABC-type antimicrobial peptide transport system permease subunit
LLLVNHNDAATLILAILVLAIAAAVSGFFPLRRTLRIEPTKALRFE